MTAWLLALVPVYGPWLLAMVTLLTCFALPIPASVLMMAAGGFVASGDLNLWETFAAAVFGGILGDQMGYWLGRAVGGPVLSWADRDPARHKMLARAQTMLDRQGMLAVFLTRWLFSPLGPLVNVICGTTRYSAVHFSLASAPGVMVWAALYLGVGYGFAGNLRAASDLLGSVLGFVAAGAGVVILGLWLHGAHKSHVQK